MESQKEALKQLNFMQIKEAYFQSIDDYNELENSISNSHIIVNANNTPVDSFEQQNIFIQ